MADNKSEKEHSVEQRLKALYQLQTYLSEIDKIRFLRGELPYEVKDLEDEIARFQSRIAKHTEEIEELKQLTVQKTGEIADRRSKIARYDQQMDNVRNNREYTFLEKEKEYENLEIELAEKNIREALAKQEEKRNEIADAQEQITDHEHILAEKREELDSIVNETKQQEEDIREKAKELEAIIDDYTLNAFKRIRKNARNGLGIVTVQRNACGGCFNRIPPQRQLEIKMHKKIIVCEYCGRIMIDGVLAGVEKPEEAAPAPTTTRRRSSKSAASGN